MKQRYYFVFLTLILFGIVTMVLHADSIRTQVGLFASHDGHEHDHNHVDNSDVHTEVDEALLRVPLPPVPIKLMDDTADDVAATGVIKSDTQADEYQRQLPGAQYVETDVESLSECSAKFDDAYGCYADYLTNTVQTKGIEEAFIETKASYNAGDQQVISLCHQLAHVIGRAATAVYPTVAEAYNYGDTFCWSGYYHGIMEAIIVEMGIDNVPKQLNDICVGLPGKSTYSFNYFNCVHGLGHGLMYVENHELFDALVLCDDLSGEWERSSCYGGVYMENVIANEVDHFSKYLKTDDPLYPCNVVEEKYKQQCYLMQTSYILKTVNYDFAKVFDVCALADPGHISTCYQSLGRDASGYSVSDPQKTKEVCLLGSDDFAQSNCVAGAVKDFISYHHSDEQALSFCETLPESLVDGCFDVVESYYSSF